MHLTCACSCSRPQLLIGRSNGSISLIDYIKKEVMVAYSFECKPGAEPVAITSLKFSPNGNSLDTSFRSQNRCNLGGCLNFAGQRKFLAFGQFWDIHIFVSKFAPQCVSVDLTCFEGWFWRAAERTGRCTCCTRCCCSPSFPSRSTKPATPSATCASRRTTCSWRTA